MGTLASVTAPLLLFPSLGRGGGRPIRTAPLAAAVMMYYNTEHAARRSVYCCALSPLVAVASPGWPVFTATATATTADYSRKPTASQPPPWFSGGDPQAGRAAHSPGSRHDDRAPISPTSEATGGTRKPIVLWPDPPLTPPAGPGRRVLLPRARGSAHGHSFVRSRVHKHIRIITASVVPLQQTPPPKPPSAAAQCPFSRPASGRSVGLACLR